MVSHSKQAKILWSPKKRKAESPAESPFRKSLVLDVITPNNVKGVESLPSSSSSSSLSQTLDVSFGEIAEISPDVQNGSALTLVRHSETQIPIISESVLLQLEEGHRELSSEEQILPFRLFRALQKPEPSCPELQTLSFPPSVSIKSWIFVIAHMQSRGRIVMGD